MGFLRMASLTCCLAAALNAVEIGGSAMERKGEKSANENGDVSNCNYLVVNLENGEKRYTNETPDLSKDICRTTELWLRRISAGTFTMGSPDTELGRDSDEKQHLVTLTRDYYIGIFECTQRQWELIMGNRPSHFDNSEYYMTRPVEQVSYNDIRGESTTDGVGWPEFGHAVDADSFLGRLREKTGLEFDIPTEAEWEYACRAGTTTTLNSGKELTNADDCPDMAKVGRYYHNGGSESGDTSAGATAKVGSYLPNAWGLYDMHGNVWEWCLDWYEDYPIAKVTNPQGAAKGLYRLQRGGCWSTPAQYCRSAIRISDKPSTRGSGSGLRVVLELQ